MTARATAALLALAALVAGCGDAVVGGRCAAGYRFQRGAGCVRAADDGGADGAADDATAPDGDATAPDGGDGGGGGGDGARDDGGGGRDVPTVPCANDQARCDGVCVDTASDPAHCGGCGRTCAAAQFCSRGSCQTACEPPLVACGAACVDLNTDQNNCGACGRRCRSGICSAGVCRDARAGHLVVIGHSFTQTRADQNRVLANAVFLAASSPARVLVYERYADTTPGGAVTQADLAISTAAGPRPWTRAVLADSATISRELSVDRYDVMLVYEQRRATDAQIASIAADFGPALQSFVRSGGVAIVLDGPTGNGGTFPLAVASGLLTIGGVANIDGQVVELVAPADALAVGVSTSYRAAATSVHFDSAEPYVVFASGGRPVVMHRAVVP